MSQECVTLWLGATQHKFLIFCTEIMSGQPLVAGKVRSVIGAARHLFARANRYIPRHKRAQSAHLLQRAPLVPIRFFDKVAISNWPRRAAPKNTESNGKNLN
nr:hypothetical protein [Gammaproteobacteria bacterium]